MSAIESGKAEAVKADEALNCQICPFSKTQAVFLSGSAAKKIIKFQFNR